MSIICDTYLMETINIVFIVIMKCCYCIRREIGPTSGKISHQTVPQNEKFYVITTSKKTDVDYL